MRYAKIIPSTDKKLREKLLSEGWQKIKEPPSLFTAFIASLPFIIINGFFCYLVIYLVERETALAVADLFSSSSGSWSFTIRLDYIIYTYLLIVFHEVFHLILIPGFISSDKTYFGIKPWGGFVFTREKINKSRYLLISLGPFLVISVIMPILLGLSGLLSPFLVFLVFLNATASSVDVLNAFIILIRVPGKAAIIGNGFESYYKV